MAVPARVARPTASSVTDSAVTVNWKVPAANGPRVDRYRVRFYEATGQAVLEHEQTTRSRRYSGLDPNSVYRARVQARNADGWGPWSDYLFVTTRIGRPVGPDAPDVVQVNDGRHMLEWVRNASADRPYTSERVLRQDFGPSGGNNPGGSWGNIRAIGQVTGQAPRFTDDTTQPNRAYAWWIEARNSTGSTRSATSGTFRTTPAAPSGLVAVKNGTDITVTYSQEWPGSEGVQHEFEVRVDGAPAVAAGTVNADNPLVFGNVSNSLSYEFRARTSVPAHGATGPRLFSAWSEWSNLVPPGGPPLAPSLVFPAEGDVVEAGAPLRFEWLNRSTDTSPQTQFEVEYVFDTSPTVTLTGGSDEFVQTVAGQGILHSWRARTRGETGGFGPWSPWTEFWGGNRPGVVIQSPAGGVYDGSLLTVTWDFSHSRGDSQGAWEAELLDAAGNLLETRAGAGAATSTSFTALLSHDATYTVRVRAKADGADTGGAGLWSEWDQADFVPEFPLPAEVRVHAEWDTETGSVPLTFDADIGAAYVWDGTPGQSTSTKTTADGTTVNIVKNGSFERGVYAWDGNGADVEAVHSSAAGETVLQVTSPVHGDWGVTTSPAGYWDVTAGQKLGLAYEYQLSRGVSTAEFRIDFLNTAGAVVGTIPFPTAPGTGYKRFSTAVDVPPGAVHARFRLDANLQAGSRAWIHSLIAVEADTADAALAAVSIYFDGDTQDTVPGLDAIDVQRNDGSGWITLAIGLDPETSTVDYTPCLGTVRYRAISRTDLPAARLGPETVIEWEHTGRDPIFVNGGEAFETVRTAIGHEVTDSPDVEQDSQQWAGWAKPTPVFGEGESDGIQFQGNIIPHLDDARASRDDWKQLLKERRIVCYRDCQGRKLFGLLHVAFASASSVTRLTLDITQTHHIEGIADQIFVPEIVDPS